MKNPLLIVVFALCITLLVQDSLFAENYDNRILLAFEDVSESHKERFRDVVFGEGTLAGTIAESSVRKAWDKVFDDPLLSEPTSNVMVMVSPDALAFFVFGPSPATSMMYKPSHESFAAETHYLLDFTIFHHLSQLGKAIEFGCLWRDFSYTVPHIAYIGHYSDPKSFLVYQEGFLGVMTGTQIYEIHKENVFEDLFIDGKLRLLWYIPREHEAIRTNTLSGDYLLKFFGCIDSDLRRVQSRF